MFHMYQVVSYETEQLRRELKSKQIKVGVYTGFHMKKFSGALNDGNSYVKFDGI